MNIKNNENRRLNLLDADLNLLKVFDALYIERNVTKAANRLNIAQSSLSSSLRRLRILFSDELFIRSSHGMLPTKRAIEIEPSITECLLAISQAITVPKKFKPSESKRTFIIGGSDFSAFTILPKLITFLKKNAPHIRLEMKPFLPEEAVENIDNGTIDFAICSVSNYPKRLYCKNIFNEDMVVIARNNHPVIKDNGDFSLEQYAALQHIYITSKGEGEKIIDKELQKNSLQRDIYLKVQNFLIAPYIVENSDLVATVSERVAYQCSQRSKLIFLPFPAKIKQNFFCLLWSKTNNSDQECLWLIETINNLLSSGEKPHA